MDAHVAGVDVGGAVAVGLKQVPDPADVDELVLVVLYRICHGGMMEDQRGGDDEQDFEGHFAANFKAD